MLCLNIYLFSCLPFFSPFVSVACISCRGSGLVCRITPAIWVRGPAVALGAPAPVSSGDQGGSVPPLASAPAASGVALLVAKALPVKVEEIPSPATSSKAPSVPQVPERTANGAKEGRCVEIR